MKIELICILTYFSSKLVKNLKTPKSVLRVVEIDDIPIIGSKIGYGKKWNHV